MKKKGIVYIVQNPAFPHLFKIGYTWQDNIDARGLNASNVPEDFEKLFAYECDNPQEIEKYLHDTFKAYRHYTKYGRKTEFFYIGCLSDAKRPLELLLKEKGATNISNDIDLDDITLEENNNLEYDRTKDIEEKIKRSSTTTFDKLGIELGTILVFTKGENEKCEVISNRTVLYKGKEYYLSSLAKKLIKEGNHAPNNKSGEFRGSDFFRVKNGKEKTLTQRRKRMEKA